MRKLSGLVLVGALLLPISFAQAAEVIRLPANNMFANAIANDPDAGSSTGVFVTRQKGQQGGPVDSVFFIISSVDGFLMGSGVLPQGAFQANGRTASLNIDINDMTLDMLVGEIPANSVISINWEGTGEGTRVSGVAKNVFGNVTVSTVGTRTQVPSDVTGAVFGAPMPEDAFGDMATVQQVVLVVTQD